MGFFGKRFREAVSEFLAYQAIYSDDRRTTPSNIRILTRYLGEMRIPDIGPGDVEAMMAARLQEGIGRSTLNRQRATLSRFFNWAISREYHPGPNPLKKVRKFRESPGRTRYLTPDEAARLLLASAPHLKRIIMVALHTGGRLGELLALRWRDIDLDRRIVTFRKETTKSRRERVVPISVPPVSPDLLSLLCSMRRGGPEDQILGYRGEPVKSVRSAFERARSKAGLPDLHFHDLRHTFASWYIQNGGDPYRLQKYLGHSTMALTQRYAHLSQEFLEEGARYFGPPGRTCPMRETGKPEV